MSDMDVPSTRVPMDDRELVARFLRATSMMSLREVEKATGINRTTVGNWQRGAWSRLHPGTRRRIASYIGATQAVRPEGARYVIRRIRAVLEELEELLDVAEALGEAGLSVEPGAIRESGEGEARRTRRSARGA